MPVISATREAEIRRIKVSGQPKLKKFTKPNLNRKAGHGGV
jgi:hypothetical protein